MQTNLKIIVCHFDVKMTYRIIQKKTHPIGPNLSLKYVPYGKFPKYIRSKLTYQNNIVRRAQKIYVC